MDALMLDLFQAYYDARRNKRNTVNQLQFEIDCEHHLFELYRELVDRTYRVDRSIAFVVEYPVKREIFAANFRDRIIHHLIVNYITPVIEAHLIDDCYSCRKGRGTHYGIQRMEQFMRECSENYTRDCYVLKLDVQGYFMSIDKQLLWKKLERILEPLQLFNPLQADLSLLWWMLDKVVWNDPTKSCIINGKLSDWEGLPDSKSLFKTPPNCGLPIGNLTSQLFSNVYMYDFDCFVKNTLGITYYGRYVDDFVLMHRDKAFLLEAKQKIDLYLRRECHLELHPHKIYLQHYRKGFAFLGAYILPYRTYIGRRVKKKFSQVIFASNAALKEDHPDRKKVRRIESSINSYLGIMRHYRTYRLRRRLLLNPLHPTRLLKHGYIRVKQRVMTFVAF